MNRFDSRPVVDSEPPRIPVEAMQLRHRQEKLALEERFTDMLIWMIVEARSQRENRGSVRFDSEKAAGSMRRMKRYRKEQDEDWIRTSRRN